MMDHRTRPADLDRGDAAPDPSMDVGEIRRLRFADRRIEAEFRADYGRRALVPVRRFLLIAGVLYASLGLLDGAAAAAGGPIRGFLSGVTCPMAVGLLLLSYIRRFARLMEPAIAIFGMVTCAGLASFSAAHREVGDPSFTLLMAALLIGNHVLRLRHRAATLISATTMLAFVGSVLGAGIPGQFPVAVRALFLGLPALLGVILARSAERGARAEFFHRRLIQARNEGLDQALREVQARRLEAEAASRVDPLTALYNRRHFFSVAEGRPEPGPFSVIILDVDHFKLVNDTHGHAVGDQVLRAVAARIKSGIRPGDVACRYGGEEFAIFLPGADLYEAAAVGERLRAGIASGPLATDKGPLAVSVSAGIAASGQGQAAVDLLVERADQALYQAKHGGRNNVKLWRPGALIAG